MQEIPTRYTVHSDPGHAWVQVQVGVLEQLNIATKISKYSYRTGHVAYLEEDRDAGLLIEALKAQNIAPTFAERSTNSESFVRNLPDYWYPGSK